MEQIAVLTRGLWRLRHEVGLLTGQAPVRWDRFPHPACDAVAGWGHAVTANRARRLAARSGKPYIAFEDGPLRSVKPGPAQAPMSMVADRTGIYYESAQASDLVALANDRRWFTSQMAARAEAALEQLRQLRLSKYNSGRDLSAAQLGLSTGATRRVLVIDQVHDDASIRGANADASSFAAMLEAALDENPAAEIIVKLHPDVLAGRRVGYFSQLRATDRLKLIAEAVNPWSLLDVVDTVYAVSSGLGLEAAMAGKTVVCFGSPFYSGWGFTDDRSPMPSRPGPARVIEIFAAYYLLYARYFDAYSRREIAFETACEQLAWLRDRFVEQGSRAIGFKIARWKRRTVDRMLDGPAGPPLHTNTIPAALGLAKRHDGRIVAWASRDVAPLVRACAQAGAPLVRAEDGFIRSSGLGASFVQPLSLVFDARGIYYDSRTASDLEHLLEQAALFTQPLLERARRLRESLIEAGTTKYNTHSDRQPRIDSGGRPIILVPGQVEDDASIRRGSPSVRRNLDLLHAVRRRHPDGFIVYKPHPDVEAGLRRGRIGAAAAGIADIVAAKTSILPLIALCDRLETMTSLAGFEALLRGKPVTTHGQPFYAGWGLTDDLAPLPRRARNVSLDELVAAALILYPRYLDPVSGLPCRPELLVDRLASPSRDEALGRRRIVRFVQISAARALGLARALKRRGFEQDG